MDLQLLTKKIDLTENKYIWLILKKCSEEMKFLAYDDEISFNKTKTINAIITRGTPSTEDNVFLARDLAETQRRDQKISDIINKIEKNPDNPSFRKDKHNPRKLINGFTYSINNRILLASKDAKARHKSQLKIVLPEELHYIVTWKRHNTGHLAEQNTVESLKEKYHWNKDTSNNTMFSVAQNVSRSCLVCQFFNRRSKYPNPKLALLHLSTAVRCGEGIVCDVWESGSNSGEKSHLIISVCVKCRFTKAKALRVINSTTIGKFLVSCCQTMIPKFFLTDNASYFISKETRLLFEGLNNGLSNYRDINDIDGATIDEEKIINPENIVEILLQEEQGNISNIITTIPIVGDGSCLYRAILKANDSNIEGESWTEKAKELRKHSMSLAKHLITIPNIINQFTTLPDDPKEKAL